MPIAKPPLAGRSRTAGRRSAAQAAGFFLPFWLGTLLAKPPVMLRLHEVSRGRRWRSGVGASEASALASPRLTRFREDRYVAARPRVRDFFCADPRFFRRLFVASFGRVIERARAIVDSPLLMMYTCGVSVLFKNGSFVACVSVEIQ
jgi:hypothetical protein